MEHNTPKEIAGTVNLWGINCSFHFSNKYNLEIEPAIQFVELFQEKCEKRNLNFDNIDWIYGVSTWNESIAFHPATWQGTNASYFKGILHLIVDIYLLKYGFLSSETGGKVEPIQKFKAIDFCGKNIDAIFSPKCILKNDKYEENRIEWFDTSKCAKSFKTSICGIPCTIIFTVFVDRKDTDSNDTSLGKLRSILRLEFQEFQDVSLIETCWQTVCYFLTFCTGQFNITNLSVYLWDKEAEIGIFGKPGIIDCQINCERAESVEFKGNPHNRFQIAYLGEKVGNLFELIGCEKSRPRLDFLPQSNTDFGVDSHKIRDLCTAFELEYDLRKEESNYSETAELVSALKDAVKKYKAEHPFTLSDDIYNSAFKSLKFIGLPVREKIWQIYSQYKDVIDAEFKWMCHIYGDQFDFSESKTKEDIHWFVKLRNKITHSSLSTEQDIPNAIYLRLATALYCSVLERAGYTYDEISAIIRKFFNNHHSA